MEIPASKTELRELVKAQRRSGAIVGFVPTMGALHAGHMSLFQRARRECDFVVASIFVNPTQFDRDADLDSYPSKLEADIAMLEGVPCDALFTTRKEDMYAADFSTWVLPEGSLVGGLCGASRGSHFRGVTTVVSKLFHIVPAHRAYFGQKDYQQLAIIRRMVRDLDFDIEVLSCPTVRESDGLALSSRNALLEATHRRAALAIPKSLRWARQQFTSEKFDSQDLVKGIKTQLEAAGAKVDYVEVVEASTLEPEKTLTEQSVLAIAAYFGEVRLIDNHLLSQDFPKIP